MRDLNLDRIFAAIRADPDPEFREYLDLGLSDRDAVIYRHDVFRDVANDGIRTALVEFVREMAAMRSYSTISARVSHPQQKHRFHLDAVLAYCALLIELHRALSAAPVRSAGLRAWRDHLTEYLATAAFTALRADSRALDERLRAVRFSVSLRDQQITVDRHDGRADYTAAVQQLFHPLLGESRPADTATVHEWPDMNHVEERILDHLVALFPEPFAALDAFWTTHREFIDSAVATFDHEITFYLRYRMMMDRLGPENFCYPDVTETYDSIAVVGAYDLALALTLRRDGTGPVANDFALDGTGRGEYVLVVTGPNQGGKTTFARSIGQLAHLTALGCPVPARHARFPLVDRLFTHFERSEELSDPEGTLQEEIARMRATLGAVTDHSLVVMNESFSSTTTADALDIGTEVLGRLVATHTLTVFVTFLDELAALPAVVSMVAGVDSDPDERTFRLERRPADGKAHAVAMAEKFGLTYDAIVDGRHR